MQSATIAAMARDDYIQVRVTEEMKRKIASAAERRGLTVSALIMNAVMTSYPEVMQSPTLQERIRGAVDGFDEEAQK
jgi:uncharacterized protein (DUF1778 family)